MANHYFCGCMKLYLTEERKENRLYLIIWIAVFLVSALRIVLECIIQKEGAIDFRSILQTWEMVLPFLVLFVVHNFFIAPQLVYEKRPGLYTALALVLLGVFFLYYMIVYPGPDTSLIPPEPVGEHQGPPPGGFRGRPLNPDIMRGLMGVLLVVANTGVKVFFRDDRERERLLELEKENLTYQLENLRYQINPHFFMNTLNNIHALVDIEPEKAKECIVELSKLMRHILYDSDKPTIPLRQELDYLENYVSLMRIRYPDETRIEFTSPAASVDSEVPPLVFSSFVENAFKHGLSLKSDAFVRFSVSEDAGKVIFKCLNSRPATEVRKTEGIGLQNIRRRLELLYGSEYTLHIEESPELYDILLVLPSKPLAR